MIQSARKEVSKSANGQISKSANQKIRKSKNQKIRKSENQSRHDFLITYVVKILVESKQWLPFGNFFGSHIFHYVDHSRNANVYHFFATIACVNI